MNVARMSVVSFTVFIVGIIGVGPLFGLDERTPRHPSVAVIVVYAALVAGSFVYAMYLWIAVMRYGDRRLVKRGVEGTAEILSSKSTNIQIAAGESYGIGAPNLWKYRLQVSMPGKKSYATTLYICAHLRTGAPLQVSVSRFNRKRVTVDLAHQAGPRSAARAQNVMDVRHMFEQNSGLVVRSSGGDNTGHPDRLNQLQQLADLRDRGVLTDAEFSAEKAKLLAAGN